MTNANITKAVELLRAGKLVAFPTETVYGLGGDASNENAVRAIFRAKERPYNHPLIVHIGSIDQLDDWAASVSPAAMRLADAFWPGPLTIILKKQPHVLDIVTGSQGTVGLRIPKHPVAAALLKAFGSGIAAPSANKFMHISPTTAGDVEEELGNEVDLILEGGACEVGLESTIVDMSHDEPMILRPGMISEKSIAEILGTKVSISRQDIPKTRAPGMHHLHYAPTTKTILMETTRITDYLYSLKPKALPIAFVMHTPFQIPLSDDIHIVTMPNSAIAYAHDLYHTLRILDNQRFKQIVIEAVPNHSEWGAIRDRLVKATAMR